MFASFFAGGSRLYAAALVLLQLLHCGLVHAADGYVKKWGEDAYAVHAHFFNDAEDAGYRQKLLDLKTSEIQSLESFFEDCPYEKMNLDLNKWNVRNCRNMKNMFASSKCSPIIKSWDVSAVTNMEGMFKKSQFWGDISDWEVSSVRNMEKIFEDAEHGAELLKQTVLWNTTKLDRKFFDQPCPDSNTPNTGGKPTGTLEARCPGWWKDNNCNDHCLFFYDVNTNTVLISHLPEDTDSDDESIWYEDTYSYDESISLEDTDSDDDTI